MAYTGSRAYNKKPKKKPRRSASPGAPTARQESYSRSGKAFVARGGSASLPTQQPAAQPAGFTPQGRMDKASFGQRVLHWAAPEGTYDQKQAMLGLGMMVLPGGKIGRAGKTAMGGSRKLTAEMIKLGGGIKKAFQKDDFYKAMNKMNPDRELTWFGERAAKQGRDRLSINSIETKTSKAMNKMISKEGVEASKAAAGKLPKGEWQIDIKGAAHRIPTNTKTDALKKSYIGKVVQKLGTPKMVAGALISAVTISLGLFGTTLWGKGEAVDTLGFARRSARELRSEAGDRLAAEITEMLEPLTNPTLWDSVKELTPFINMLNIIKAKAAAIKKMDEATDLKLEEEDLKLEERRANKEWHEKRDAQKAEEAQTQRDWQDMRDDEKMEADKTMREFWTKYLADKQLGDEKNRQFWAEYQANKQKFWDAYRKKREEDKPSSLGFGLL